MSDVPDHLEDAMNSLAIATDIAAQEGRPKHAAMIGAALIGVEDLRLRNEEYDPETDAHPFPKVFRRASGEAFAVRVALAKDGSRAIYRNLNEQSWKFFHTPHYVAFPPEQQDSPHRPAPQPLHLSLLRERDAYEWDSES